MPEVEWDIVPETVEQALELWDAGKSVFSVEMGGIGPGYEMAIQGLAFELIRALTGFDWSKETLDERFRAITDPVISACNEKPWGGFSGAQVGSACNLAGIVCRLGYRKAVRDPRIKDRTIQVCKKDLRQER